MQFSKFVFLKLCSVIMQHANCCAQCKESKAKLPIVERKCRNLEKANCDLKRQIKDLQSLLAKPELYTSKKSVPPKTEPTTVEYESNQAWNVVESSRIDFNPPNFSASTSTVCLIDGINYSKLNNAGSITSVTPSTSVNDSKMTKNRRKRPPKPPKEPKDPVKLQKMIENVSCKYV